MQYRGRMVAYANKEIPNLPDEAVPDREQNILQERYVLNIYIYIYLYIYIYIFIQ